jgi:hypothetical protein
LIELDEVHKFAKCKTPFSVGCGHPRWSCEREELAELGSISRITTWSVETLRHRISEMQNAKRILIMPMVTASGHMG